VNIEVVRKGKRLKDITKIRNITKDIISSYGKNPKSDFLRDASMSSIRNPNEKAKQNPVGESDNKIAVRERAASCITTHNANYFTFGISEYFTNISYVFPTKTEAQGLFLP